MEELDFEVGLPLDLGEGDLVGVGGVKELAVDAARAELFDAGEVDSGHPADPFHKFVAGGEVARVEHDSR